MDYAITPFNGGEILEGLFNGLAVCLNSYKWDFNYAFSPVWASTLFKSGN